MNAIDYIKSEKRIQGKKWSDLAQGLGITPTALSVAFSRNSVNDDYLKHVAKKLGVDIEKHLKQTKQKETETVNEPSVAYLKPDNDKKPIPYFNIDFTSSFVESFNSQKVQPDAFVTHPFFEGCDYIVRNSGQSMAKLIKHGDAIGLKKIENWQEFLPMGEVYAIVTTNGFRMIKIITAGKDDDHYTLVSKPTEGKKEEFPPQQIKKAMILHVFRVEAASHQF